MKKTGFTISRNTSIECIGTVLLGSIDLVEQETNLIRRIIGERRTHVEIRAKITAQRKTRNVLRLDYEQAFEFDSFE